MPHWSALKATRSKSRKGPWRPEPAPGPARFLTHCCAGNAGLSEPPPSDPLHKTPGHRKSRGGEAASRLRAGMTEPQRVQQRSQQGPRVLHRHSPGRSGLWAASAAASMRTCYSVAARMKRPGAAALRPWRKSGGNARRKKRSPVVQRLTGLTRFMRKPWRRGNIAPSRRLRGSAARLRRRSGPRHPLWYHGDILECNNEMRPPFAG